MAMVQFYGLGVISMAFMAQALFLWSRCGTVYVVQLWF